ncbi:MAG: hypothetical protein AAF551_06510, partial [Bacteroidota bacterium]
YIIEKDSPESLFLEFILEKAYSKKESFTKRILGNEEFSLNDLNLEKEVPFKIDLKPDSPLNQVETFDLVNEAICFYCQNEYVFDYLACKKFLDKLASEQKEDLESDFLTFTPR